MEAVCVYVLIPAHWYPLVSNQRIYIKTDATNPSVYWFKSTYCRLDSIHNNKIKVVPFIRTQAGLNVGDTEQKNMKYYILKQSKQ